MKNLLAVLVVVSAIGCGGGGGSSFSTSVQGSKPLGTLSTTEAATLCKDTSSYLMAQTSALNSKENQCRATGLAFAALSSMGSSQTDAMIQQACQAGYALCESAPADDGGIDTTTTTVDCTNAMAPPATCTATVSQYSACLSEQIAVAQGLFTPCNQLTAAKLATLTSDGGTSASAGPACAAFDAACPDFDMTMSPLRSGSP